MAKKYLLDTSIIASSMEDFKRRFVETDCTLVLSDLTFRELEPRKKDKKCEFDSVTFARFLIDLFVRDTSSTEICLIEYESNTKHIDEELVKFAGANNMSILTSDKGMALWCRFYNVDCELLETRSSINFPFIKEDKGSLSLNINKVSTGFSVFVYSPEKNKIMAPLAKSGLIFLNPGNIVLVAHPENGACGIDTYYVCKDYSVSLIGKDIYSSEEDIDTDGKPFHKDLYTKCSKHIKKIT